MAIVKGEDKCYFYYAIILCLLIAFDFTLIDNKATNRDVLRCLLSKLN